MAYFSAVRDDAGAKTLTRVWAERLGVPATTPLQVTDPITGETAPGSTENVLIGYDEAFPVSVVTSDAKPATNTAVLGGGMVPIALPWQSWASQAAFEAANGIA